MVTLAERIAADVAATAFDTAAELSPAEPVSYTPFGGSASSVSMIFPDASDRKESFDDGQAQLRDLVGLVRGSQVASPAVHDTIVRNTERWTVVGVRDLGLRQVWELTLHRSETSEKSRGDFRRGR